MRFSAVFLSLVVSKVLLAQTIYVADADSNMPVIKSFNAATNAFLGQASTNGPASSSPYSITTSQGGLYVYFVSDSTNYLQIYSGFYGLSLLHSFLAQTGSSSSLAVSPNNQIVYVIGTGDEDLYSTITSIRPVSQTTSSFQVPTAGGVAFSTDSSTAYITSVSATGPTGPTGPTGGGGGGGGGSTGPTGATPAIGSNVLVVDTSTNSVVNTITGFNLPQAIAVYEDTAYVADTGDNCIRVIDLTSDHIVNTIGGLDQPQAIAVTPDGAYVYVTNYGNSTVSVMNTSSYMVTAISTSQGQFNLPTSIAISAPMSNGTFAYVVNTGSKTVSVINTSNNSFVGFLQTASSGTYVFSNPTSVTIQPSTSVPSQSRLFQQRPHHKS